LAIAEGVIHQNLLPEAVEGAKKGSIVVAQYGSPVLERATPAFRRGSNNCFWVSNSIVAWNLRVRAARSQQKH
jgi:hypothetical protein